MELSEEQQEHLKQIRELQIVRRARPKSEFEKGLYDNIYFLLALLDNNSQAAEPIGRCVSCGHDNYDLELKECRQRWMEGRMSVVCGCPCAKHNSLTGAATRMRDKCVEKAREIKAASEGWHYASLSVADTIIAALESLTLDQE